jgi:hypothetical protein
VLMAKVKNPLEESIDLVETILDEIDSGKVG